MAGGRDEPGSIRSVDIEHAHNQLSVGTRVEGRQLTAIMVQQRILSMGLIEIGVVRTLQ